MDEYGMIDIKTQEVFVEIRNIINQVEAEYTCENCVENGKCAICDNFNIKFCSDLRPIIAPPPYIPKGE